jgi:hypothetical protein
MRKGTFAMIETVAAVMGLVSAGISLPTPSKTIARATRITPFKLSLLRSL